VTVIQHIVFKKSAMSTNLSFAHVFAEIWCFHLQDWTNACLRNIKIFPPY